MEYASTDKGHLIRLEKGEEISTSLASFCTKQNIHTAFFQIIGAVSAVELSYYHLDTKDYTTQFFNTELEILGITGNIALVDGKPFAHMHGSFSNEKFECIGGHVKSATISATGEIYLVNLETNISREFDEAIGLKLLHCPLK